jgi:hypothetical protein
MAVEELVVTSDGTVGGTTVTTLLSLETILNVIGVHIPIYLASPNAIVVLNNLGLDLACASSGKNISVTSDGTLAGTTVETADGTLEFPDIERVVISIDDRGLRVGIKFSTLRYGLNSEGEYSAYSQTGFPSAFNHLSYITVDHPAVPLTSDKIMFTSLVQFPARTSQSESNPALGTEANWSVPNQNTNNATWINEGANVGHYSATLGGISVEAMDLLINGTTYHIETLVGDGTGAGGVTLNGNPGGDYAITWARGITPNGSHGCIELTRNSANKVPINNWFYLTSTTVAAPAFLLANLMGDINSMSFTGGTPANTTMKWAESHDNGVTWYYPTTEDTWATIDVTSEWAAKGGILNSAGANWRAADNNPVTDAGWSANLGATPISNGDTVLYAFAIMITDPDVFAYNQSFNWNYDEPAFWQPLLVANASHMQSDVTVRRISTTQTSFYNKSYGTDYANAICSVWVGI